ncbi:hypothetical protein M011DRAFT_527859 [Sporormia fimetaria CBS 119925]|uniref:Uncharacterized protein n=1 Tax=Sporormia fimetaria CBS 119925 TaxID=1340428 RepID=A0A6A6V7A3_9PLEO|nr:hypothetical protein M011DRAFT_527859 [Sporormia fimetaria CBS 119925]
MQDSVPLSDVPEDVDEAASRRELHTNMRDPYRRMENTREEIIQSGDNTWFIEHIHTPCQTVRAKKAADAALNSRVAASKEQLQQPQSTNPTDILRPTPVSGGEPTTLASQSTSQPMVPSPSSLDEYLSLGFKNIKDAMDEDRKKRQALSERVDRDTAKVQQLRADYDELGKWCSQHTVNIGHVVKSAREESNQRADKLQAEVQELETRLKTEAEKTQELETRSKTEAEENKRLEKNMKNLQKQLLLVIKDNEATRKTVDKLDTSCTQSSESLYDYGYRIERTETKLQETIDGSKRRLEATGEELKDLFERAKRRKAQRMGLTSKRTMSDTNQEHSESGPGSGQPGANMPRRRYYVDGHTQYNQDCVDYAQVPPTVPVQQHRTMAASCLQPQPYPAPCPTVGAVTPQIQPQHNVRGLAAQIWKAAVPSSPYAHLNNGYHGPYTGRPSP